MNVAERLSRNDSATRLVVRCLGRFRLEDQAGNQMRLRTRKARAMLAALALNGRPMSRDALADLLWSDRAEEQARSSLRQTIFELQHFDGEDLPILSVGRDEIAVRSDLVVTDVDLIRRAANEGDWPRLMALLEDCEPGLLTDLDGLDVQYDDWLRGERAQEPARTFGCAIDAVERCLETAGPRAAQDLVAEVLRLFPESEEATRLAMRIDHELGDNPGLHRHFHGLRDRLRDDYGAEPAQVTVGLFERLTAGVNQPELAEHVFGASEIIRTRTEPASTSSQKAKIAAIVAVVSIVIAAALIVARMTMTPGADEPVLVAVLPFEEQPAGDRFIADGLGEQTRLALSRNSAIRVLGRTTTSAMTAERLEPRNYLQRFGVTHLLEGSVLRSGNKLLVSVSLTRTSDGVAVWQDKFQGRMGEPFALQDAIAEGIEGKLRARLASGGGRRAEEIATTPEVYALYSQARQLISTRERPNFRRAEALLRQAVKADPNYAPAWSLLGAAIYFNGRIAIVDSKARAEGLAAVRRALALAPNFAPAHATLALIQGETSPEAEPQLRRAVALDPSYSEAWNWLGNSLASQARLPEAIAAYERALEIDPLMQPAVINLSSIAAESQDRAASERLLRRTLKAGAVPELVDALKANQAYARGDYSEALKLLQARGLDAKGGPKRLLWGNWFETLTAIGYYDYLHQVTGCPDWYAPLVDERALPPTTFEGKPVTPEEFWTSDFFSAPASRALVVLHRPQDLVRLYRAGYRDADDFISSTARRDMLPELAANLAVALKSKAADEEANYILVEAGRRLEQMMQRGPSRSAPARLAMVRAVQGERAQAIALLRKAISIGWLPDGRAISLDLSREPAFQSLRGDPQFEAVRKRILDHVTKERAELKGWKPRAPLPPT